MDAERVPQPSFARAWWQEILELHPSAGTPWGAVRVGVSVAVPLAATLGLGRPDWAGYAVMGSLCSVYGKRYGYADRLRAQLGIGAGLVVGVLLGTVTSALSGPGSIWSVLIMSLMSVLGLLLTKTSGWFPVPSLFLVFAAGTASSVPHTWQDVPHALVVSMLAVVMSVGIGQMGRITVHRSVKSIDTPRSAPLIQVLAGADARASVAQYGMGPLAAGSIVVALTLDHPHWAAITATVPLVGSTLAIQLARATHRLVGTALGCGLAFAVIALQPSTWVLVLVVALFQILTELFVTRNYGIAVICITPLALVLSHLAVPEAIGVLVADRLDKTLLGVAIAIAVLLTIRPFPMWRKAPP